ncbi:MAG: insulinase family protein [Deltaproteobacteria bacterium]|nr:insulinase family protein [Deltaproteobacteria bacterium]
MRHLIAAALVFGLLGAAPAKTDDKLAIPFEKYRLPNGLEVILHQDRRLPLVAVNVWYHVGAVNEKPGLTGFAHLFEHMMFSGSAHLPDHSADQLLDGIGATDANGSTGYDRTNYIETVPSNHLESALWIESDKMGFLLNNLTQAKLDNQRGVVQNERRQSYEAAPYGLAEEKLWQTLFPAPHPYYGNVIGSMADIDAATLGDVKQFFRTWYAPSNATLTVAGDFNAVAVRALIEKYFGSLPAVSRPVKAEVKPVHLDREVVLKWDEKVGPLPRVMMAWHSPAFFAEGDAAADLLSMLLAAGESALLQKRLVRELEIAQSVEAMQESHGAQSVFHVRVTARPGVDPERLRVETDAVLDQIRQGRFTDDDVKRVQNRYETYFVRQLQKLGGFSGRADMLQTYNHFVGDPGYLARDLERYRKVTRDDIVKFAREVLANDKRAVVIAVPTPPAAAGVQP